MNLEGLFLKTSDLKNEFLGSGNREFGGLIFENSGS